MNKEPVILTVQCNTLGKAPPPPRSRGGERRPSDEMRRSGVQSARRTLLQMLTITAIWPTQAFGADATDRADKRILVLGDSLSAEYGIGRGEGWVTLLERARPPGAGALPMPASAARRRPEACRDCRRC